VILQKLWLAPQNVTTMKIFQSQVQLLAVLLAARISTSHAYVVPTATVRPAFALHSSTSASSEADFSAFADSLDVDDDEVASTATSTTTRGKSSTSSSSGSFEKPWQAKLEELLDPMTSGAQRQILLSELLNANEKIRESVLDALSNRKVRESKAQQCVVSNLHCVLTFPILTCHPSPF
jgi:helix-turn-helix protein